jgi:serine/threonine protein kinase
MVKFIDVSIRKSIALSKIVEIDYYDALVREIIILQYLQEKTDHVPKVFAICLLEDFKMGIIMEKCSKIGIMGNIYLPQVLKVFTKAISDLHSLQIVHRDLTPNNLMLRPNNSVCIIDYGLACFAGSKSLKTNFSTKVTTLTSRPPELIDRFDFCNYDPFKVDVFGTAINALFYSGYKTYIKNPKSVEYEKHILEPLTNALHEANFDLVTRMTSWEPDGNDRQRM